MQFSLGDPDPAVSDKPKGVTPSNAKRTGIMYTTHPQQGTALFVKAQEEPHSLTDRQFGPFVS